MGNRIAQWGLLLVLVCGIIAGAVILGDVTGALDLYRAQQATRRDEAEASRLQAEVELTRARADVETAAGERAILEAAARAVDSDRRLVTWYTLRGDLRALLGLVGAVGLAICAGALVVILKGVNDAQDKDR
ncbi:MAG: hypothetical protein M0R06_03670 [Sphaerochaeta sp.]|jgi:hypothetical protein|nr:hypothetical protein [Sphaerochaeta sp.]